MTARKILIIEDNEQNLYLMRYLLEKNGYEVESATTGKDGIRTAIESAPCIILLDIQLPLMDGYSVARELRKVPGLVDTPIIVVTSYAMAGDKERALACGATDYIEKPIDPSTFVSQIAKYCRLDG